jgi:hypothetical protein
MKITTREIEMLAPNADAARNGRDLHAKKKYIKLNQSDDATLLFGQCAGSGKNPYHCSVDYLNEDSPVFRCSCPSRQIPCKHVLGLMYAFANGDTFVTAEIPEDIASKRDKITKRAEKKEKEAEAPETETKTKAKNPKARLNALTKKVGAQLDGVALAEKLIRSMVQTGLSTIDAAAEKMFAEQIKQLGNYYIGGIQTAFNDLLLEIDAVEDDQYTKAIDQVNYIYALLKKSKEYLITKKENPEVIELNSAIEEQIGYAWKLSELMEHGLSEKDAELIQLAFYSYDDEARREYVDEGYWFNLNSGRIFKTKNYRPYKAQKFIKAENSFFDILQTKELFIYPGDLNPRVRWDQFTIRTISGNDMVKLQSAAAANYADLVKTVKASIKNPLVDKHPLALIQLHKAYKKGEHIVLEDKAGNLLTLRNIGYFANNNSENTLQAILPSSPEKLCLTVMFENDIESGLFTVQPLSLITEKRIIRLLF